jgi:hypothetical protein
MAIIANWAALMFSVGMTHSPHIVRHLTVIDDVPAVNNSGETFNHPTDVMVFDTECVGGRLSHLYGLIDHAEFAVGTAMYFASHVWLFCEPDGQPVASHHATLMRLVILKTALHSTHWA